MHAISHIILKIVISGIQMMKQGLKHLPKVTQVVSVSKSGLPTPELVFSTGANTRKVGSSS